VIAVLRALGLGDLLTAVPALRALRAAFPHRRIVLATRGDLAPLAMAAAHVDAVVPTAGLDRLDPSMRDAAIAVNLHGRGPRSTRLLAQADPERLVAFDLDGGPCWDPIEHERHRWCRLLVEAGLVDDADPDDLMIPVSSSWASPAVARGATVVHPGAAARARRWPPSRWAGVARAELAAGRRVVVTGSPDEVELARTVARLAGIGPDAVVAGSTDALELLATVAAASRVVCGDTGVAHVAFAVGTPAVVLYGPVPPSMWGPPPQGPYVALWHGRTGEPNAEVPDAGLLGITADEVVAALARLPASQGTPLLVGP
jgi:ADP-heptose:LPS heptosyltransferase